MKLKICLLAFTALAGLNALKAQTVDDIINKYVAAIGGKDVINQINSVYTESNVSMMGNDIPSKTTVLKGKGYKNEMEANGSTITYCYSDKGGWMINPMIGATSAQAMPDEQYKIGKAQLDIVGPLYNYKEKGFTAELVGQEKVGDVNAYKIKLTTADSVVFTFDIDPNTYYIIQSDVSGNFNGQEIDITTSYSDYRKSDIGYVMPWSIDTNYGGQFDMPITVTKVEFNQQVDPAAFDMPK